ncbi:hypothetical protein Bca4012_064451 [Brassica carinata]
MRKENKVGLSTKRAIIIQLNGLLSMFTTIHIFLFQAFLLHIHTNTNGSIDHGVPTSNALQGQESFNPYANTLAMPVTYQTRAYQNYHALPASSNSGYNYWVRDLDHFSDMMVNHIRGGDIYRQGEDTRRPYKNHQTYHSNSNSGYNHGASHMTSHRREGDAHRERRDTWVNLK